MTKCDCENSKCGHEPGKCPHSSSVGSVCKDCANARKCSKLVCSSLSYKGQLYVEAGAKLPISYTDEDTKAVDKAVGDFVSSVIASLKPGEKPSKDLGKALSYVMESLTTKLKEDPMIKSVDSGSLPKELR